MVVAGQIHANHIRRRERGEGLAAQGLVFYIVHFMFSSPTATSVYTTLYATWISRVAAPFPTLLKAQTLFQKFLFQPFSFIFYYKYYPN